MSPSDPFSRIRVVLSHPAHPGNIGAAARALKTMGLSRLYLVRPKRFVDPEARALSSNALDVLASAVVCDSLDEALAGTTLSVAVSARSRVIAHASLDARTAAAEAVARARTDEVAFVFGNETTGLSNDEVMKCNRLATIPSHADYTSLNLAAAVQVVTYECRMAWLGPDLPATARPELASHEEVEKFFEHLERSLYASGFLDPDHPRRLKERLRRLFTRSQLEKEEVSILRGILTAWEFPRGPRRK
jgi:tRNA/rRNA methyltransferase